MTRILTGGDLRHLLDVGDALSALRSGFVSHVPVAGRRFRTDLPFPGTATALLPGTLDGVPAYSVKVNAKFPAAVPALRGVVCLHAGSDGELLAILDSATITAWRTGLSAALATDVLASPGTEVAVIGAGAQAHLMLTGLTRLRGALDVVVHDVDADRAASFARAWEGRAADSATAARAPIVLTATWSRTPLLSRGDVAAGGHVTSLGADEPGKRELSDDLLEDALLVVDDVVEAGGMGVLAGLSREADATLGEILRRERPGRSRGDQITVYSPVGLPWQDLALAWLAFEAAEREDAGVAIDLLGEGSFPSRGI